MPGNPQARGVFEAVEQARVEAIGARRMAGVAKNLTAMLDDHFHRGKFDEITDRADAPLSDALAMLVRERLTGLAPPPAARKMVDLWRPLLEDKIGARLDQLDRAHRGPGQVRRRACMICCRALELGDDRNADADDDDEPGREPRRRERPVRRRRLARLRRRAGDERRPGAGLHRRDVGERDGKRAGLHLATPSTTANSATTRRRARRRGRIRAAPTSRAGRNITPSRRNSTR